MWKWFFLLEAAWLNEVRCPGGRPSVSWSKWKKAHLRWWWIQQALHLNNKNLKKHGTNRGKGRRQPHRGCQKQKRRGKPASTIWSRDILARQLAGDRDHACQMVQSGFVFCDLLTRLEQAKHNLNCRVVESSLIYYWLLQTQASVWSPNWPMGHCCERVLLLVLWNLSMNRRWSGTASSVPVHEWKWRSTS